MKKELVGTGLAVILLSVGTNILVNRVRKLFEQTSANSEALLDLADITDNNINAVITGVGTEIARVATELSGEIHELALMIAEDREKRQ